MSVWKRCLIILAILVLGAVCSSSAMAVEPWWHLSMGARPSTIPARGGDSEQEIETVSVQFFGLNLFIGKLEIEGNTVACLANPFVVENFRAVAEAECGLPVVDENAAQLQATLQEKYGPAMTVAGRSGGVGVVAGGEPLVVTGHERGLAPLKVGITFGTASTKVLKEGGSGKLALAAYNIGDAPTSGAVTLSDVLPPGLTATGVIGSAGATGGPTVEEFFDPRVKCTIVNPEVSCAFEGVLQPYERLEVVVWVNRNEAAASGERNVVSVGGGGAREVSLSHKISYGEGPVPFGVEPESNEVEPEEEGGMPDMQAGSHPFQLTASLRMNETTERPWQPAQPRNLQLDLPAGLVGDAQATPQCTYAQFTTSIEDPAGGIVNRCPADTAIGVSMQEFVLGQAPTTSFFSIAVPVFNITPSRGEPARFGFRVEKIPVILDTAVRTGSDYGVRVTVHNLSELGSTVISSVVTLWGVPGDARHSQSQGWACLFEGHQPGCGPSLGSKLPLLSMPTACEAFQTPVRVQSWKPGAELLPPVDSMFEETLDGCNQLPFGANIETAPDVRSASMPSGLTVHVHVPQEAALNSEGLTDADVRDTTVAFPPGVTLNPGGAEGLEACSEAQIGFLGKDSAESALNLFTSTLPVPFCPDGSKIATVKITTPLLPNPLEGAVYVASPASEGEAGENPFNGLIALYIVAEDPVSGSLVKLPGEVVACERTGQVVAGITCQEAGQLISSFEDTPQLPFEDLEMHLFGGEKAPLATPALCGSYTTQATFTPWSGGAPVHSISMFQITSGPHGGLCPPSPLPFSPEFVAETTNVQAGGFSELRTTMGHPDGDQALDALSVKMPPGLSGVLSGVKLCEEPQAGDGTCGAASLIGHTVVTAGFGSSPLVVKRPGNVYLTGPYNGRGACKVGEPGCAPFGLSIANPAEAGPFDLENGTACDCVVVRAKVEINPITAQLNVVSDSLPTMIKGVPLDLQHVQVAIDRPDFTFNPTSCNKMQIEGSMSGDEGANVPVSSPFQVTDCKNLAFSPSFGASTAARTSKRFGASLHVKITFPKNSLGKQANIREVKVALPKRLPSRLSTLQKACFVTVFEKNPALCPAASRVGFAKASTPILPVPLTGPAYFVSNGGAKFPELVIVLQGYGITIDLHGETFIHKNITTSTFKTAPDQPIESFELSLPEGEDSAIAANGGLCYKTASIHKHRVKQRVKLVMPTMIVAQDGSVINENTKIAVLGCKGDKAHGKARSRHKRG
jgi:hypothetical protein